MSRTYKVTYKTYFNERLRQVSFHGKLTHPLYIQVTFDRRTTFYKSYYFELFSKPRYFLLAAGKKGGPTLEQVIAKENELIDFVIEKTLDDFSLERFREQYLYYCRDLCDLTEVGFREYLFTFFHDKGMPIFAAALNEGSKTKILYDVVRDLKTALKTALYDELIENSFYYAPPYLPLFGFMMQFKKWPLLSLSVMELNLPDVRNNLGDYTEKYYPGRNIFRSVDGILT
ncbi:MAG: hypothetical protein WD824_18400 [Cyclobacteriaceae bacterium]